jgi:hypothetical protein
MKAELIRLDTWIKTFALRPKDVAHWLDLAKKLRTSETFTLDKHESTTGRVEQITLILE